MRLFGWFREQQKPITQADANAKLKALMAKRLKNHPDYTPRYRPEWAKPDERFDAQRTA